MLSFFDYVYFSICKAYSKTKATNPAITAAIIVTVLQCLNILGLVCIISLANRSKVLGSKIVFALLYIAFLIFNYVKYIYRDDNNYETLKIKYDRKSGTLALIYILISTVITISFAAYVGSKGF
jgi:hypothetical protein